MSALWIFVVMILVSAGIIVWYAGSYKETHLSTQEIIAASRRKYNLDV